MVARSIDSDHRGVSRVHHFPRQPTRLQPPVRSSLRPRLTALAPGLAEVVRCAGGWLFDQVMAGWDVTVVTADACDERALRILGASWCHLEKALAAPVAGPCLEAVALNTGLYVGEERVRRLVLKAAEANGAEIRLWGDAWPDDFDDRASDVSHELSIAARAFKSQALKAVAGDTGGAAPGREVFRRGEILRPALAAVR